MKNKIGKFIFIIFISLFCILDVHASNNLLVGKNKWKGYFSGNNKLDVWTEAKGKLESNSINKFMIDMQSVGHWVEGDPSWHFGAQAKLVNQKINFVQNKYYTYNATILSDKDRRIFAKITEVEMNSVKQKYQDIDNVLFEKWITLKANVPYNLDETFLSTSNVKRASMYYAVGWNDSTDIAQSSPNKIEVSNISIKSGNYNLKDIKYKDIDGLGDHYYKNIVGTTKVKYKKKDKNIKLRLDRPLKYITKLMINNKNSQYNKADSITAVIPIDKLNGEYNDIAVYTKTSQQNKSLVFAKIIIKNTKITKYKNKVIKKLSKYGITNNSDALNLIIKKAEADLNDANSKDDIDRVYNEFKVNFDVQKSLDLNVPVRKTTFIQKDNDIIYTIEFIVGMLLFVGGLYSLVLVTKKRFPKKEEIDII